MSEQRIQGVIFDLDGTLGDTLPLCISTYQQVFKEFLNRDFSDEEVVGMFGPTEEGILKREIPERWEEAYKKYCELYEANIAQAKPMPNARELLDYLKEQEIHRAMVTGKGPDTTEVTLRKLDLADEFDTVKTGSTEGSIKPQCIDEILSDWKIPPDSVLYVGDAPSDGKDAKKAGIIPVTAAWGNPQEFYKEEPHELGLCFESISEFLNWLRQSQPFQTAVPKP